MPILIIITGYKKYYYFTNQDSKYENQTTKTTNDTK